MYRTAYAHVGDRVLALAYQGAPDIDAKTATQALKLVIDAATDLPKPAPVRTVDACEDLDELAAAALDTEVTIKRGTDENSPSCTWGTAETMLRLSGGDVEDAEAEVDTLLQSGGSPIEGLGTSAAWASSVDGSVLRWSSAGGGSVNLTTPPGVQISQNAAVALAQKAKSHYD